MDLGHLQVIRPFRLGFCPFMKVLESNKLNFV